ncbi:MAG: DNA repair protein RecN [Candidatus Caldatribacteriota bacterium]
MLFQLNIKNIALIKELNIEFDQGLNVLTGETGAGKSIIIEAINLILGSSAHSDLIRSGEDNLLVEALFHLSPVEKINFNHLQSTIKLVDEQGYLIIRREINRSGRNKCWINQNLINLSLLQEIGNYLIDLHGQHSHQYLLDSSRHIDIIDSLGEEKVTASRKELFNSYKSWREKKKKLNYLIQARQENLKRIGFLKFQLEEIDKASLQKDEDKVLEEEERVLRNAERIIERMEKAVYILYEGVMEHPSLRDSLNEIVKSFGEVSSLDHKIEEMREKLKEIKLQIDDLVYEIENYKDKIELNTQRLKEVEERLNLINNLKNKYGDNIEEILKYRETIYQELKSIDYNEEEMEILKKEINELTRQISKICLELSLERKKISQKLEERVVQELDDLNMKKCSFKVDIQQITDSEGIKINDTNYRIGPKGIDQIEFLISPNPGEKLKPLSRIISGGEVSRVMLALKSILAQVDQVPTLIFDEIDSGVGARLGEVIAQKLKNISQNRQVICVTHLPQIACRAKKHFYVEKYSKNDQTYLSIGELSGENRVQEIARMLDGNQINNISLRHAREMLERE